MTKHFCDKCGAEMEATRSLIVNAFPLEPKTIALCNNCSAVLATLINDWMSGGFWA